MNKQKTNKHEWMNDWTDMNERQTWMNEMKKWKTNINKHEIKVGEKRKNSNGEQKQSKKRRKVDAALEDYIQVKQTWINKHKQT